MSDEKTERHGDRPAGILPAGTAMGAVTLGVTDLEAGEVFYRHGLGLAVRERGPGWSVLGTPGATLLRLEQGTGGQAAPGLPGLYHLAILVPDRATLGAWLAHALESGLSLQGAADHAVSEAIYLADPEGNGIEVYRDRPRETWEMEQGRIVMTTEPLDVRDLTATAAPRWEGAPEGTIIGHVHLQVGELARSAAFYGDVLGFPQTNDSFPGACFLGAGGYHHHLGLNTWGARGARGPGPRRPEVTGLRRFEVFVPDEDALAAARQRLSQARHQVRRRAGEDAFDVSDPDGLELRVRLHRPPTGRAGPP